jgi:hypothetical protein
MPMLRLCGGVGDRRSSSSPASGREKPSQVERGGLARPARSQQRDEGAGRNIERDLIDRLGRAERLGQLAQPKLRSAGLSRAGTLDHWQ